MENNNQSNSNPSPSNDIANTPASEKSSEQVTPSQQKSFKAFGTYNPSLAQETQHAGEQNFAPTGYSTGDQTQYSQTYGSSNGNPQQQFNYPPPSGPVNPLKHSGLGITSFILSLVSILVIVIGFVTMFSSISSLTLTELELMQDPAYIQEQLSSGDGDLPSSLVGVIVSVVLIFGSGFFSFLGIIFGIIGVCMKNRRKIFGILGTVFNGLLLVGGFIFFMISLMAAGL